MPRAIPNTLYELHELLAKEFKEWLKDKENLDTSMLNVIRQFLKDNRIEALPRESNGLDLLVD